MNRRGLTWTVAGTVGLVLIVLGAHLAWERQRNALPTPRGGIHLGMTDEGVRSVLGLADYEVVLNRGICMVWDGDGWRIEAEVSLGLGGATELTDARLENDDRVTNLVYYPSLVEYVRSWFTGNRK